LYEAVREAQAAGVQAVGPGVASGDVDDAARSVLRKNKLGRFFTHSTGHGVGLEIHEAPRLAKRQREKLQAGMVVTVEPGAYIPRSGGVRIEDMVVVTESGRAVLTTASQELITL
jgi:Xaa-Pro aminopeptidase